MARPNAVINPQTKKNEQSCVAKILEEWRESPSACTRPDTTPTVHDLFWSVSRQMRSAGQGPFPKSSRLTRRHQNGSRTHRKAAAVGRQRIERGNSEHLILPLHSLAQQCRPFENSETFLQFPSLISCRPQLR